MKAAASRRSTRDLQDLRDLAERLNLSGADDIVRVHDEMFPDDPLGAAKIGVISEAMRSGRQRDADVTVRCRVCGRTLRSPASIAAGVGPICATHGLSL